MRIDTPENMEHLQRIFPLIPRALDRAQAEIGTATFSVLRNPTRSAIVHDLIIAEAEQAFNDDTSIHLVDSRGLRHLMLPNLGVRFHRGSQRGQRIRINQTRQSKDWYAKPQLVFDGFPDPNDRFHLVYVPDVTWTRVDSCVVGLYYAEKAVETRDIDVDAWYAARNVTDLTRPEATDTPRITLKPAARQAELEGTNDGA